jgi:Fe-S cluster biosynthesis and repair protein YggX
MPGPLGARVFDHVCAACWREWLQQQTAMINHYGLDLRDAQARQFLTQQTEAFLFAATPPSSDT